MSCIKQTSTKGFSTQNLGAQKRPKSSATRLRQETGKKAAAKGVNQKMIETFICKIIDGSFANTFFAAKVKTAHPKKNRKSNRERLSGLEPKFLP